MIQICWLCKTALNFGIVLLFVHKISSSALVLERYRFYVKGNAAMNCQHFISPKKIITHRVIILYRVCQSRFTGMFLSSVDHNSIMYGIFLKIENLCKY